MNADLLTLVEGEFDRIPKGSVFAVLITDKLSKYIDDYLINKKLIFVAKKGNADDWAIYMLPYYERWPISLKSNQGAYIQGQSVNDNLSMWFIIQDVCNYGYKPFTEGIIRSVVPCSDAVFEKYRK